MSLVLLHALPLDGSMWPDEVRALGHSVVAPSLYRLGDSIEQWASAVLDIAGSGPLVVVGNSIGGSCAVEIARIAPKQVKMLVLIGAKAGHRPEPEFRDAALRVLAEEGMAGAWATYWEPLFGPGADPEAVEAARRIAFAQDIDDILCGSRVFHSRPDRTASIEEWRRPVLIISGEHDRTPSDGAAVAASLLNGTFRLVAEAGHYVPLERPTQVAILLREAIEQLPDYP